LEVEMSFYLSGNAKANVVIKIKEAKGSVVIFECGGFDYAGVVGDVVTVSVGIVNSQPITVKEALKRIKEELE
jgi:hypothetical protein